MLALKNVLKHYGQQVILMDASMQLNPGEKVGLVGPNGSGKTTIFRLLIDEERPETGEVVVPRQVTVGYFRQDAGEMSGRSVLDEAIHDSGRLGELHFELKRLEHALESPTHDANFDRVLARFGAVQEEYQQRGGYELEARAREVLHGLGVKDSWIDGDVGALSGGWKMRVAMAKVLIGKADFLLMDEPTNHLDIESIIWLEDYLKQTPQAVLMTSHDRDFMNRVVRRIIEIEDGELVSYSGNYEFYEGERRMRNVQQAAAYERQQSMLAKEQRFIDRFQKHAAKAAQVQSRVKKLAKIEKLEPPRRRVVVPFEFHQPPRSGEDVAMLTHVTKRYGEHTVYSNFNFHLRRGERWCVMGENGTGKTTLLKMVAGVLAPDAGGVRLGASLKLGYFAQQSLEMLDPGLSVWETLDVAFPLATIGAKRNVLGAFQFSGDDVLKRVAVLSGGERSRLVLARMLFDPPNFLVLDEPTNHLDLDTKQMLVSTLSRYEGTMLFVSHDRTFLKGLATQVLDLSGGRRPENGPFLFDQSYEKWVEYTGHEAPGVHS
ncbi:MAG: ABC-F family ATP-binding cassette domain-containing protein [Planctomycetota bacterium]